MTVRIIRSKAVDYVNNREEVTHYVDELEKLKSELKQINEEKKKALQEVHEVRLKKDKIIEEQKKAGETLFEENQTKAKIIIDEAKREAKIILTEAKEEAEGIKKTIEGEKKKVLQIAEEEKRLILENFEKRGYHEGFEKGFELGKSEREKISELLKRMLQEVSLKRDEIVNHFQSHLIDIALLITRKVVKSLTDSQKSIVVKNLVFALKQLKGVIKVTVHLNHEDLSVVKQFKQNVLDTFKSLQKIEIVEDPTVERGGCVVESDYSVIDAKISTQLGKIEEAIREQNPIKMH